MEGKPMTCGKCSASFFSLQSFITHMQKKVPCDAPPQMIKASQKGAMPIHRGVKPYRCSQCQKSFADKCGLKCHLFMHMEYKPYQCEYCDYGTTEKNKLQRHMLKHTSYKSYQNAVSAVKHTTSRVHWTSTKWWRMALRGTSGESTAHRRSSMSTSSTSISRCMGWRSPWSRPTSTHAQTSR